MSSTPGQGAAHLQKLNPQALNFVPSSAPAKQEFVGYAPEGDHKPSGANAGVGSSETQSDNLISDASKKHRRKRNRRGQNLNFSGSDYKQSLANRTFFDNTQTKADNNAVSGPKPTVAYQGAEPRRVSAESKEEIHPVYGHALTWKSKNTKAKDDYTRVRRNVRTVAPEQFVEKARPSNARADIFPRTVSEWQSFRADSVADRLKELQIDTQKLSDRVTATQNMEKDGIPREKRVPKSVFGGANGKVFNNGLGPCLMQPTVFSDEHMRSARYKADWPTQAEMLEDGDQRENHQVQTRAGRFLPAPRVPHDPNEPYISFKERAVIPQFPMDQTGPIYRNALGEIMDPFPAEVERENEIMNNDPTFEANALQYLGSDLMDEIGHYQPPFVPPWQSAQRHAEMESRKAIEGINMLQQAGLHMGYTSQIEVQNIVANMPNLASAGQWQGQQSAAPSTAGDLNATGDWNGWMFMANGEHGEDIWMAPGGMVWKYHSDLGWFQD
ncbi:uncharacterized protein HMPREF1541_07588 [Cyphellophora europaea CBS 101466]|uniref:Uncharacterized protein n=1 Tax=Cyphellophora europaea (strain CBS 101466) TaxID=1220924 RepID=W2RNR9_CYPE1|nr:uncharacterized protein HMPREF1541_07588 [Cyphellophora europaea CBS 101466]ETN37965.1 hypothetical protein HMPREF1541_07588 [Cyphellophora europaea CBS 101466]